MGVPSLEKSEQRTVAFLPIQVLKSKQPLRYASCRCAFVQHGTEEKGLPLLKNSKIIHLSTSAENPVTLW